MTNTIELLTLRSNTKYNYRLSVPSTYVHAHGLQDGDRVLWVPQPDGVLLKFAPPDELLTTTTTRHGPVAPASHGGES
jgi:hypothetical protein